ncbi:uncharacterized protein N7482_008868 [Penicillium canariense]|uniref:Uncharacterized protein n=1 Tax=Penicillium canariense TaxID=189055 RepID=A0A9W9LIY5_9EURO|nr:uncharacterized protein N7482_008868 [Penicillium canariense]KAJ5157768.1 hypothetical protein N7482_008868 [Penicillium canariense]
MSKFHKAPCGRTQVSLLVPSLGDLQPTCLHISALTTYGTIGLHSDGVHELIALRYGALSQIGPDDYDDRLPTMNATCP